MSLRSSTGDLTGNAHRIVTSQARTWQAVVMTWTQTSGCVPQKSWGTPGTSAKAAFGTRAASWRRGQEGRMSHPAVITGTGTGTGQSASLRNKSASWIQSTNDASSAAWTAGSQSMGIAGSVCWFVVGLRPCAVFVKSVSRCAYNLLDPLRVVKGIADSEVRTQECATTIHASTPAKRLMLGGFPGRSPDRPLSLTHPLTCGASEVDDWAVAPGHPLIPGMSRRSTRRDTCVPLIPPQPSRRSPPCAKSLVAVSLPRRR
jgi:hypothetical protein